MQDGRVIPDSRFPRDGGMAKEGHRKDDSITVQTYGTSHTTKHSFTGVVSAVIPSKRAFWGGSSSERCRGSSRSRDGRSGSSGSRTSWKYLFTWRW